MQENLSPSSTIDSVSKNERKIRVDDRKQSMVGTGTTLVILQAESLKPGVDVEGEITGLRTAAHGAGAPPHR